MYLDCDYKSDVLFVALENETGTWCCFNVGPGSETNNRLNHFLGKRDRYT